MFSTLRFTPPPPKHSVVRAQRSVVGWSRSKDLLIGRLTILVYNIIELPTLDVEVIILKNQGV